MIDNPWDTQNPEPEFGGPSEYWERAARELNDRVDRDVLASMYYRYEEKVYEKPPVPRMVDNLKVKR